VRAVRIDRQHETSTFISDTICMRWLSELKCHEQCPKIAAACLAVHQSESVILYEISLPLGNEVEHLGILEDILAVVNEELTCDEDQDRGDCGGRRLGVEGEDAVADCGKWQARELLHDRRGALDRRVLPCQHGHISVEAGELCPVVIKGSIVKVGELLGDSVNISHFDDQVSGSSG